MATQSSPSGYPPDRRLESRYAAEVPALLVWGTEHYRGTVRELSSRALLLTVERGAEELREDDPVEVVFDELKLTHEATVSRVAPGAIGDEPVSVAIILHEDLDLPTVCNRYL